jgi:GTP-dependent phosphoenolpyruvate carboxykinase
MQLDLHDANEPNVLEPQHLPDTEVLAEAFRGCLQVCTMLSIKFCLDSLPLLAMLAVQFEDAGVVVVSCS